MKKAMILCLLLVLVCGSMWAQQGNFQIKWYTDSYAGYTGGAAAVYYKTDPSLSLNKVVKEGLQEKKQYKFYPVKMTKEEEWLFWQALNEYSYKDGELYQVTVGSFDTVLRKVRRMVHTFAYIKNGKVQMSDSYHSDIADAEAQRNSPW